MTNILKTTALIAALSIGTTAVANGTFGFQTTVSDDDSITIDLVRASDAGVLAIYDYTNGEFGDLLGTTDLNAGVNDDVVVNLDTNVADQLAAVIYAGDVSTPDMASGWMELDVSDDS